MFVTCLKYKEYQRNKKKEKMTQIRWPEFLPELEDLEGFITI